MLTLITIYISFNSMPLSRLSVSISIEEHSLSVSGVRVFFDDGGLLSAFCRVALREESEKVLNRRVEKGVKRGRPFEIEVDGETIIAYEGETVAAALVAAGRRTFRWTAKKKHPRGMFCGIGLCHECIMVINGVPNTRACQTLATPGCRVESQKGLGPQADIANNMLAVGP